MWTTCQADISHEMSRIIFYEKKKKTNKRAMPCNAHLSIIVLWEPDLELIKANILIKIQNDYINKTMFVCLCWGFMAQSTQWGHVEHCQFT